MSCDGPAAGGDAGTSTDTGSVHVDTGTLDAGAGTDGGGTDGGGTDGGGTDTGGTDAGTTSTTLIHAATGGVARSSDGLFEIYLAPGALAADTSISITPFADADVPADIAAAMPVTHVYAVEPDGLAFAPRTAWSHYAFATLPTALVTAGTPAQYGSAVAIARPRAGGAIEVQPSTVAFYDEAAATLDLVSELSHFSVHTWTRGGSTLDANLDLDVEQHEVDVPWTATDVRVTATTAMSPTLPLQDVALVTWRVDHVVPTLMGAIASTGAVTADASAALAVPDTTGSQTETLGAGTAGMSPRVFTPAPPSYLCASAGSGFALLASRIRYLATDGFAASTDIVLQARIDCRPRARVHARVSDTTTCRREGASVNCSDASHADAEVSAEPATTRFVATGQNYILLTPASATPGSGPASITATQTANTLHATRQATGVYATSFDSPTWPYGSSPLDVTWGAAGATDVHVLAPSRTAIAFGPVQGLDTDIQVSSAVEISICGTRLSTNEAYCIQSPPRTPSMMSSGSLGITAPLREMLNDASAALSVATTDFTTWPYTLRIDSGRRSRLEAGVDPVDVFASQRIEVSGNALTTSCIAGRTYCSTACVPTNTVANCGGCGLMPAEICDGIDNDCDGTVDDGCPSTLGWTFGDTTSPLYGTGAAVNSSAYNYLCPFPQLITGICGSDNGPVRTLGTSCGSIAIVPITTTTPYTYEIHQSTTTPCTMGAGWAGGGAVAWTPFQCPPDTFVDSISGMAGANLGQIQVRCVGWTVRQNASGAWEVAQSGISVMSPVFGSGTGTPFSWTQTPSSTTGFPAVIRGIYGRVLDMGAYISIQARGAPPTLTLH